jgi:hypothetical protein
MKVDTKEMSRQLVLFVAYPFSNTLERYLWKILEVAKSGRLVALSFPSDLRAEIAANE